LPIDPEAPSDPNDNDSTPDKEAIVAKVQGLLDAAPERYMLGADCTIPSDTDWDNIRLAIDTAHGS
jgi:uroporphyrinogen-III decarboxylase